MEMRKTFTGPSVSQGERLLVLLGLGPASLQKVLPEVCCGHCLECLKIQPL